MKTRTYHAFDEAWGKDTLIFENDYGYMILGQDEQLHQIEDCTALYYILLWQERNGIIKRNRVYYE